VSIKFSEEFFKQYKIMADSLKRYPKILESQADKIDEIYRLIENTKTNNASIHIWGKGRSGSSAVSLALRLKHFGYNVCFIGDIIKEPIEKDDLVMLFSGSGETSEIVDVAKRARRAGAKVVGVTTFEQSSLGKNSDIVVYLPGGLEKEKGWDYLKAQLEKKQESTSFYGGGKFEVLLYLFQENLVTSIGRYKNISPAVVAEKHERDEVIK
jgi:6-phospho 3-hexuloisomerase